MPGGSNAIVDDDDDLAKLMPNMAKLIQLGESSSLESKGSTSMSFSGNSVKGEVERQTPKPGRQRRRESIFREVANKFLQRGGTAEKSASKPSALATLSSNCRVGNPSAERRKKAHALEKENVRPKTPTLVKQGARSTLQQSLATGDVSQKVSKKLRKMPSRSEGSNYFSMNSKIQGTEKSNSGSLSEHMDRPVVTVSLPKVSRYSQGSELNSRLAVNNQRGKARLYMTTMPLNLSELKEEFAEIDEEALEEEEVSVARMTRIAPVMASETLLHHTDVVLQNSVENRKDLSRSEIMEKAVSDTVNARIEEAALSTDSHEQEGAGGNQGLVDKRRNEEGPPHIEQASASPLLKGLDDKARTADSKTASVQEMSGKGAPASALFKLTNAEASCNHKRENSPTNSNVDKIELSKEDGPNENAVHLEEPVPRLLSTLGDVQNPLSRAHLPEQEDARVISLQGGTFSAQDTSAAPPRLHYSRRGRINGINQRRLTFESSSGSKQKAVAKAMDSNTSSVSVSNVKFKDKTNAAASGDMGNDPYCFNSQSPQDGRATECLKIRGLGKRTWANLGAPIDGGREWKEGRRVSTRIKSRPLDWWRGERMLYGRVHSTLCTLIGIKTTSPDPVWPRPKPQRGDYTLSNFHIDSFVDDSHCELLRLAAQ